jgi:lipopolysaccharide/colanic/teichoic acid biosynthesis glycosyltransferase
MRGVFKVKPGITGLSQVLGFDMSNPLKLAEIDELYIKKKSIYIDSLILLGTFLKFPRKYLLKLLT